MAFDFDWSKKFQWSGYNSRSQDRYLRKGHLRKEFFFGNSPYKMKSMRKWNNKLFIHDVKEVYFWLFFLSVNASILYLGIIRKDLFYFQVTFRSRYVSGYLIIQTIYFINNLFPTHVSKIYGIP